MKRTMILALTLMAAAAMTVAPAAAQDGGTETPKAGDEMKTKEAPAKPADAKPAEAKPAEKAAKSDAALTLARLAVCENVEDRAPVGEAESFDGVRQLYCFTRVEGAETPTRVFHRWYVGDEMVNEIPINVKGPRWRCWSQKSIQPNWSGACRVEVVTEGGDVLGTKSFTLASAGGGAAMKEKGQAKAAEAKAAGQEKAAEAKAKEAAPDPEGDDHAGHDHDDHSGHDHD
jgi:hypothetical protein